MKNKNGWYWTAKLFISVFMLFSAYYLYAHAEALHMLGFPDYFRIELVIAKIIGAIILLIPSVSLRIKEWVYAGFLITMLSALIAHICCHDDFSKIIFVTVDTTLVFLAMRYVSKKEYAQLIIINQNN